MRGQKIGQRTFPKGWVPFVIFIFALVVSYGFSSHNIQIAPVPEEGGAGWIWSIICFGLVGGIAGWIAARGDPAMLIRGVLGFGVAAAIGAGMLYGPAVEIAQGKNDFPSASTREYRTLLPISYVRHYEAGGKRPETAWVMLSGYNAKVAISPYDYRVMRNALGEPSDSIAINDRFCANVVVQRSGANVRIMDTLLGQLRLHTIVACNPSSFADGRSGSSIAH